MAMDEPVIKNAQKIIEKTGKYYEYEKMVMKLRRLSNMMGDFGLSVHINLLIATMKRFVILSISKRG